MIRLDDVAACAGVSKNTASRVLNNRGYISASTREKVYKAIEELNYHPNENARNLLKQRSNVIGLLVPSITSPYYAEIISAVERELNLKGYKLLLCNSAKNPDIERNFLQMFQRSRVDGLILCDHALDAEDYSNMTFPIVSVDRYVQKGVSFVSSNHRLGGQLAAQVLIRCGCKHILQISGLTQDKTPWNERHVIFEEIMQKHGIDCYTHALDVHKVFDFASHRQIVREQLLLHPDTDGFFGGDLWAVAALREAVALGRSVPENFKIVGYDGTILSEITTPPITTIRVHIGKIATAAVDTVCKMIDDESMGSCEILLNVELIERSSTSASDSVQS